MKKTNLKIFSIFLLLSTAACVHEVKRAGGVDVSELPPLGHPKAACETFYRAESLVTENYSKKMVLRYKVQVKDKKGFLECEKLVKEDLNNTCASGRINAIDVEYIPLNMKNVVAHRSGACRIDNSTATKDSPAKNQYVSTTKMKLRKEIN